jgi:hypothetical protein
VFRGETIVFTRTCLIVTAVAAALFALLGILLFPALSFIWTVIAVAIGGVVSIWLHLFRPETGTAVRIGALVAAVTTALGLAVAGSVVLFGVATAWVVPLLLVLGGLLGWRHRGSWTAALADLVRVTRAADRPTPAPHTAAPTPGHPIENKRAVQRVLDPAVPPLLAQLRSLDLAAVSTTQLCGAWQSTYWLLLDLPRGPVHDEVVIIRRRVLDELERRNPTGFDRWLQTEPRACSHPGRYLVADN